MKERRLKERLSRLRPFGVVAGSEQPGESLDAVPVSALKALVDEHRVVVLRGFAPLLGEALPQFCRRLGQLLEWEFGTVNELRIRAEAANYLYTNGAVPFHWDGAFAGLVPRYIFFHCDAAPSVESGGETLFCDSLRLLALASSEERERWRRIRITYTTEKIVHYGGTFTSPLITEHPDDGEEILRFAEPVEDLNPVWLEINGLTAQTEREFLEEMHRRLRDERACYVHKWMDGDVLIADNYRLLHGRRAFTQSAERRIRRVNIL
ncbi:MAG TPA: TauD/TfdA family dioxygenase [Pyrinomonadaceae bacterium]|jgi:alpha-ketoglutarate-dependent taurine dioxygenase